MCVPTGVAGRCHVVPAANSANSANSANYDLVGTKGLNDCYRFLMLFFFLEHIFLVFAILDFRRLCAMAGNGAAASKMKLYNTAHLDCIC